MFQVSRCFIEECMENERGQRKVIDAVYPLCDCDLLAVVRVNFDQRLKPQCLRIVRQLTNEIKGFGDHKTIGSRLLDNIPYCIESNGLDTLLLKSLENRFPVGLSLGMSDIDIYLLTRKCRPQDRFPA